MTAVLADLLLYCAGAKYPDGKFFFGDEVRLPCPCPGYCVPYYQMPDDRDDSRCFACSSAARDQSLTPGQRPSLGVHGDWCLNCQGRLWVPNPDRDTWEEVVLNEGYVITVTSDPRAYGDEVRVHKIGGLGDVVVNGEGLRGQLAEMTAIHRMLLQRQANMEAYLLKPLK